jgi:hypothetical protein
MDRTERPAPVEPHGDRPATGHETRDISIRAIVGFGVALAALTGVVLAAMWGVFRVFENREDKRDQPVSPMIAVNLRRTPSGPRLEPNPLAPRLAARAREDTILGTYGWVDPGAGIARIPIDRAMELLVQKGLPPSKPIAPAATPAPADGKPKAVDAAKAVTP